MNNRVVPRVLVSVIVVVGVLSVGHARAADDPPSGGQAPQASSATPARVARPEAESMQQMQQMMGTMWGQMIEGMARSLAKPEVADDFAAFTRNYYLALIKTEFSEEEALKIVVQSRLPMAGSQQ